MGPLKEYTITRNGVESTVLLNEADAKRLGAVAADADESDSDDEPTQPITPRPITAAARSTRNKARNEVR